jgi:hypothetical protein
VCITVLTDKAVNILGSVATFSQPNHPFPVVHSIARESFQTICIFYHPLFFCAESVTAAKVKCLKDIFHMIKLR